MRDAPYDNSPYDTNLVGDDGACPHLGPSVTLAAQQLAAPLHAYPAVASHGVGAVPRQEALPCFDGQAGGLHSVLPPPQHAAPSDASCLGPGGGVQPSSQAAPTPASYAEPLKPSSAGSAAQLCPEAPGRAIAPVSRKAGLAVVPDSLAAMGHGSGSASGPAASRSTGRGRGGAGGGAGASQAVQGGRRNEAPAASRAGVALAGGTNAVALAGGTNAVAAAAAAGDRGAVAARTAGGGGDGALGLQLLHHPRLTELVAAVVLWRKVRGGWVMVGSGWTVAAVG
jgi:hypothetical protein